MLSRVCPVRAAARERPAGPALRFGDRSWTWREVDRAVDGWRAWFAGEGIVAGGRVAFLASNRPELVFAFFALGRLGATAVPLNTRLTGHELEALLASALVQLVLADPELADRVPSARAWPEVAPALGAADAHILGPSIAAGLFTSGTSGTPRLVSLTHDNFAASATASASNLGASPTHAWLGSLPLFHVGGLAMAYRCAMAGASLVLEPRFDVARAADLLAAGLVTHASLVPTTLGRVLQARPGGFSARLEALLIGGGPMSPSLLRQARAAGLPVLQTYGLTEACSQVATERVGHADGASAGPPLPGTLVRVIDDAGHDLGAGEVGELCVSGPTVAPAYGPWLHTGDLGSLDARGRVAVWSRRTDLIVTGGENVAPAEVEQVLSAHPGVRDVAVVPVEDPEWGQVPVALVVADAVTEAALLDWAKERLARFKLPRALHFVDAVPRNANGKLMRGLARAVALERGSVSRAPSAHVSVPGRCSL